MGSNPDWVKPKTKKLVFVASPLSTQHLGKRAKTGWLGESTVSNFSAISWREQVNFQ
jgi:hypothetical protein